MVAGICALWRAVYNKSCMCDGWDMCPVENYMYNKSCTCGGWDMCPGELCTTSHVCVVAGICANVLHVQQVMYVEEV